MTKFPMHLSLVQKALLIIAVPLVCELALLAAITWCLYESEHEAARVEHAKAVIARTEDTIQCFFDLGMAYVAYDARTNPVSEARLSTLMIRLPKEIASLQAVVAEEKQHAATVTEVGEKAGKILQVLQERKEMIARGGNMDVIEALQMRHTLDGIVEQLSRVLQDARVEQQRDPNKAEFLQNLAKVLLLVGALVAAAALLVVARLNVSMTRRLNVLMDNSRRLGTGKPLNEPLPGNDEISKVDAVFHSAVESLTEAEKFKREFTNMISHDLRTPLSAVKSTLELLSAGTYGELTSKAKTKVQRAEDNLRHTIELINSLLDLEKLSTTSGELEKHPVTVAQMIQKASAAVASLAESRDVEIVVDSEAQFQVQVDEKRIVQVLINLLGNAIKFSPQGSTIRITAAPENHQVRISVCDQGPGVPAAHRERIFEQYQQVPESRRKSVEVLIGTRTAAGTGLGLAICKSIVEAHGGKIGVDSESGAGAAFWFTVPS